MMVGKPATTKNKVRNGFIHLFDDFQQTLQLAPREVFMLESHGDIRK